MGISNCIENPKLKYDCKTCQKFHFFSPILYWVWDIPIMNERVASQFNSAIWRLTTMKLGRNNV